MSNLGGLTTELLRESARMLSGRLLTSDQIGGITSTIVGKYFADWFPEPEEEVEARRQIQLAQHHLVQAQSIIADLRKEAEEQAKQLEGLEAALHQKKELAEHYAALAAAGQDTSRAFRSEMETVIRQEAGFHLLTSSGGALPPLACVTLARGST